MESLRPDRGSQSHPGPVGSIPASRISGFSVKLDLFFTFLKDVIYHEKY